MSAGVSTAPVAAAVAHHGQPAVHPDASIALTRKADGTYTSTQGPPDTGTRYKLNAAGTITPIGSAVVTGSFHTPGFIQTGEATGKLKIVGSHGTLTLKLREPGPITAGLPSASGGPIILVNDFTYSVVKGTGQYAKDHGTGTVEITTTPGLTSPTGPGIYMTSETGIGRTTLTFESGVVPDA